MTSAGSSAPPLAAPSATLSATLVDDVRAALDHLYDSAFLHNHTATWRLRPHALAGGISRAQRVRTVLLDAIEQLRPEQRVSADDMRAYAILTYRCIDGLAMDEIAAKLGLSRRQAYREYAKGVEAVTNLIWDLLPPADSPAAAAGTPGAELPAQAEATRLDAAANEVARLTSNLCLEPVELPALVRSVAELLAPRTEQTGVALCLREAAPPAVLADRALLRQALLNLFSYALDLARRGGDVTVACCEDACDATLCLATSADALPPKREGVGVSVAQMLIEAMGGRIQVQRAAGEWRCCVALPAARRDTVLVVDDNTDLTTLFGRYAAGHQLNVTGATNGVQALELARELRPQLILLDLMLSPVDGWEILQQLRSCPATQTTPIVICSVLNERDLAFSLGASDYVTKPISQATLVDVLQRWLGKRHPPA